MREGSHGAPQESWASCGRAGSKRTPRRRCSPGRTRGSGHTWDRRSSERIARTCCGWHATGRVRRWRNHACATPPNAPRWSWYRTRARVRTRVCTASPHSSSWPGWWTTFRPRARCGCATTGRTRAGGAAGGGGAAWCSRGRAPGTRASRNARRNRGRRSGRVGGA
jgi:hypothetical protein